MVRSIRAIAPLGASRHRKALRHRKNESGAMIVFSAFAMLAMLGIAALVVDLGNARQETRRAQSAADAAALAGAQEFSQPTFSWTTVVQRVKDYAEVNFGTPASAWAGCADAGAPGELGPSVHYPDSGLSNTCISADRAANPTTLRVTLPKREIRTFFGFTTGTASIGIGRSASASVSTESTGSADCILCILDLTAPGAFRFASTSGDVRVTDVGNPTSGRGITINSNASGALNASSTSGSVIASSIKVRGSVQFSTTSGTMQPTPTALPAPIDDPLASAAVPVLPARPSGNSCVTASHGTFTYPVTGATATINGTSVNCTLRPGHYQEMQINATSGVITLQPGLYFFTGSGLTFNSTSARLTGTNTTLYFTCTTVASGCASGQVGSRLNKNSTSGDLVLAAPSTGPQAGMSIFYDRNNAAPVLLSGTSASTVAGTIYARSSTFETASTSGGATGYNSMMVVNRLQMSTTSAVLDLRYNEANNAPTAQPVTRLGLVR